MHSYKVTISEHGVARRTMRVIAKNSVTALRTALATMQTPGRITVKLS